MWGEGTLGSGPVGPVVGLVVVWGGRRVPGSRAEASRIHWSQGWGGRVEDLLGSPGVVMVEESSGSGLGEESYRVWAGGGEA